MEVYQDIHQHSMSNVDCIPRQVFDMRWRPPANPLCKLNFDAGLEETYGLGIVVRNSRREVEIVVAASRMQGSAFSCYALLRGILCQEMNLNNELFEGDAKHVVDGVNGNTDDLSSEGQLIKDI
ncbi:uncharacterized protein LOC118349868 [Juglans regia]|uniref:Uncharacterized protein LOC118349868 n=1 Tax=Juglans regia TaxID=51240 RepID=A0A6P9FAP6_JUGRE|nr:uncharacterized protein LOC118349868 [Juglans regia]